MTLSFAFLLNLTHRYQWHHILLTTLSQHHLHRIVGSTSFCGWTAGRCHVAYSTGITYPNLPVMKNPTRGKKEERDQDYGITNGECYKTRWKMGILILDCFAPSSRDLQRPDAGGLRRALCSTCMWVNFDLTWKVYIRVPEFMLPCTHNITTTK